eukprot:SAG11_NODE_30394_length_301_cov_1.019802_1_plen_33_part_01
MLLLFGSLSTARTEKRRARGVVVRLEVHIARLV